MEIKVVKTKFKIYINNKMSKIIFNYQLSKTSYLKYKIMKIQIKNKIIIF